MKDTTRRAIAYIAAVIILDSSKNSIYDYSSSQHHFFSGTAGMDGVSIYDYSEKCFIKGDLSRLYHYGEGGYISLAIDGSRFSGYNYVEGTDFSGSVNGNVVQFYDAGDSSTSTYVL